MMFSKRLLFIIQGILYCYSNEAANNKESNKHAVETIIMSISTESTDDPQTTTTIEPLLLNSTFASCDEVNNCTQTNATGEPPIKQGIDKNDTKVNKKEESKTQIHSKYGSAGANICTCNLQANFCDINCCCDPDCSAIDKSIFKYCELDENRYFDDRYCNYVKYIYVNNTPFEWEVNQEGLFCVITSNLPKSHLIQNEKPIKSVEKLLPTQPFWRQDLDEDNNNKVKLSAITSSSYVFGDAIMIIKNDSAIDWLRLPNNLLTEPCVFEQDVFFLKDERRVCSQMNIDEDNARLSFSSFFQDFKVISNPKWATKQKMLLYHTCPKNICIEIEPKLCDINLINCSNKIGTSQIKFHCSFNLKENLNDCKNAVRKIHYKFHHNGTYGLHKVEVLAAISNFSYHFGGEADFQLIQHYSWDFVWVNQTKNYSQIFSGNPGYLVGKPILIGTKLVRGNQTYLERNSSNFIDNFMAFPGNVQGKCVRNDTYNVPVNFGYNLMTKCRIIEKVTTSSHNKVNKQIDATDMCKSIQEAIFDLWGIPGQANQSLIFGLFGNANQSNINEDWNEVLYPAITTNNPREYLHRTLKGTIIITQKNTSSLVCNNISTLLNVDVFYSRVDLKTVSNQHKILGITMHFVHNNNKRNQTFSMMQKGNNTVNIAISLGLVSQVSFHDITTKKERRFVDPPSLDIRLPYDFFYPFIKIGSGSGARLNMPNTYSFVMIGLVVVLECVGLI